MLKKLSVMVVSLVSVMGVSAVAFAQEAAHHEGRGAVALGAALVVAIAALGGTLAQGRAVSAALDGIARNPQAADKIFVPMILGVSFIESLVIFCWIVSLWMANKI